MTPVYKVRVQDFPVVGIERTISVEPTKRTWRCFKARLFAGFPELEAEDWHLRYKGEDTFVLLRTHFIYICNCNMSHQFQST